MRASAEKFQDHLTLKKPRRKSRVCNALQTNNKQKNKVLSHADNMPLSISWPSYVKGHTFQRRQCHFLEQLRVKGFAQRPCSEITPPAEGFDQ